MLTRVLSYFSALFGLVCSAIALLHIAIGPSSIPGSVPVNATMDSEDRFYATLFLGFGIVMVWSSRSLLERATVFRALMAVFFVGGIARIVSASMVGPPSGLFIFLGALELIIPPVCWLALSAAERNSGIKG
jgi:hypothetical protein